MQLIRVGRVALAVVGYVGIGFVGFWLAPAKAQAVAESDIPVASEAMAAIPEEAQLKLAPPLKPFEMAPADPGAIKYADMVEAAPRPLSASELSRGVPAARYREATSETKESVEQTAAWVEADHGEKVHNAWSRLVTQPSVKAAAEASAAYEAGTAGMPDTGVR